MKDIADSIGGAELIHKVNEIEVLNLMGNGEFVSRADIPSESGPSAPSASRIVEANILTAALAVNINRRERRA